MGRFGLGGSSSCICLVWFGVVVLGENEKPMLLGGMGSIVSCGKVMLSDPTVASVVNCRRTNEGFHFVGKHRQLYIGPHLLVVNSAKLRSTMSDQYTVNNLHSRKQRCRARWARYEEAVADEPLIILLVNDIGAGIAVEVVKLQWKANLASIVIGDTLSDIF